MQIKILDVAPIEIRKGPKSNYKVFKLMFSQDGSSRDRDINQYSKSFNVLKGAEPGQVYEIDDVKNSNGYWDWNSAKMIAAVGETAPVSSYAGVHRDGIAKTAGQRSTWETAEERAAKQVMIVRQSSISSAVAFVDGKDVSSEYVLKIAKEFEAYVMSKPEEEFVDDSDSVIE